MSRMSVFVQIIWACSTLAQLIVLVLLFLKGNFRKLPFFTAYIALNVCQAGFLVVLYFIPGINSRTTIALAWISECVTLLAQALATIEVLRLVLGSYRGIWALAWRMLAVVSTLVIGFVAMDARRNFAWAIVVADRGYHLTFATAVIACLFFIRYYSVAVPRAYKLLLAGFCFYSCTVILITTLIQAIWYPHSTYTEPIWQALTILSFAMVQVLWMVALRKPLPAEEPQRILHPASIYLSISPEINKQLQLLNEKLMRLWKFEARSH